MSLPTMTGTGRLTADPELRFATSGTAVCTVPLAFNARRYDRDRGQWEDGDVFFVRGTLFGDQAEHASESYHRGTEVVVAGRLKTDKWQDKNTGENRTATSLLIDAIGGSTRYAKLAVTKMERQPSTSEPPAPAPSGFADSGDPPF